MRKDQVWSNLSIQREFLSQDVLLVQEKAILLHQRRGDPTDSADRSERVSHKTQLNEISSEKGYFQCHSDYLPSVVFHKEYCEVNDPAVEF